MNETTDKLIENVFSVGNPRPGFENLEIDKVGSSSRANIRYVYCSGVESWSRDELRRTLNAVMKILQPGGVIRVATPDLDAIIYGYLLDWKQSSGTSRAGRFNDWRTSVTSQFVFNEEELRSELENAGFVDIWRLAAGASSIEVFLDCEEDATELVLEARKPASMND
jgi:predicted SAM-dependent methyltransferase